MAYEYLLQLGLSIALLTSPAAPPPELFKMVRRPLVDICLCCEVMDPREVRYVLATQADFVSDLRMLKARAESLADCPSVNASVIFPDRSIVNELLLFNRSYRQHLELCLTVHVRNKFLTEAKEETDYLYSIWDKVRDARCEYYYVHIRRQALGVLMRELGPENFWRTRLPPHVPTWRFTAIR